MFGFVSGMVSGGMEGILNEVGVGEWIGEAGGRSFGGWIGETGGERV